MTSLRHAWIVGNSDGIGLALTSRLLNEGWRVTGISRRGSPVAHAHYEHTVLDITSPSVRSELAALLDRRGQPDLCVYCAGIGDPFDLSDLTNETLVFRVNLVGAVEVIELLVPAMIARKSGHIIALSSIGDGISRHAPAYTASKSGLSSYLGGLALALRASGVRVSNLRLGFVDTKMAKSPMTPMMMRVDEAVALVMRCVEHRPARITYPWTINLLVRLADWITTVRLWFA